MPKSKKTKNQDSTKTNWVEKDSPEYYEFIEFLQNNHKEPYGSKKKLVCVI
jgi:hypothetical protein